VAMLHWIGSDLNGVCYWSTCLTVSGQCVAQHCWYVCVCVCERERERERTVHVLQRAKRELNVKYLWGD
jgi:hypothetical protein